MQLTWSDEDEKFRTTLRAFLAEHAPGKPPKGKDARLRWARDWAATKFDHGFAGPSWPLAVGGMDLPFTQQVIYQQEMARARVPGHPGTGMEMVGPTIIKHGTPEQRERFIKPMLRADELWAQAFSEPGAGSDLPSLRTSAVPDGDHYVVTGQKIWNSNAEIADMFFALVRTGAPDSRQHGITYLLIDAHAPGVEVRPLRDLTGAAHFCEIFLDDVRVPVANRVGEENDGWRITRTTLGHERSAGALNQGAFYRRIMDELIALAKERGVTADAGLRRRLVDFDIRARLMEVNALRSIAQTMVSGEPGPSSSISRLYNSEFEKELHVFATDLLGGYGALATDDEDAVQRGRWVGGMLRTRASTIGAGTAEIQRNTIAEQVLGLPRDPAMPPR
ncbi:acyl-CoA dehydrogenase family protein [Cryptosporangium aurantiacum]|uniref:Acyl-CoA dehydrogenase n=1 Tax=Cryptosporangium aurantiacum TaxID=134849 RepID=A0A1M7PJ50_9ACTN|nr:acyl-CoA dehydrogenase family protein [Cryptosporangium aurantiacum]SHN17176.1 Acyl-CoA dehydrogenase [Cryptosporangium aurantiacum]